MAPSVVTVPCVPWVTPLMVNPSPSTSLSLASTFVVIGVSSFVVTESSTATGLSLTLLMVRFTVPTLELFVPSLARYVKESAPL